MEPKEPKSKIEKEPSNNRDLYWAYIKKNLTNRSPIVKPFTYVIILSGPHKGYVGQIARIVDTNNIEVLINNQLIKFDKEDLCNSEDLARGVNPVDLSGGIMDEARKLFPYSLPPISEELKLKILEAFDNPKKDTIQ